jgi:cytochrome c2
MLSMMKSFKRYTESASKCWRIPVFSRKEVAFLLFLFSFFSAARLLQAAEIVRLPQGWNQAEAESAYHLYEGSQIMPLRWFNALEHSTSGKKIKDGMSSYGLVNFDNGATGIRDLPLGMTVGTDSRTTQLYGEEKWVGINCTACHTGLLEINGRQVLIEGGASLFEIRKFEDELISSVDATLKSRAKFNRFVSELGVTDAALLRKNLELFHNEFGGWVKRNHTYLDRNKKEVEFGPGRIDGLGGPTNDLICRLTDRLGVEPLKAALTDLNNCRSSQPATSLPHLWGITQMEFVQWNGAVHSSLGRNFGQSTATYGKNWVEMGAGGKPKFQSTAHVENLYTLERLYDKLTSPSWESLVAAGLAESLDPVRLAKGEKLYSQHCLSCHAVQPQSTAPNSFGNSYWKVEVFPASTIGTDASYVTANESRRAILPKALASVYKSSFGEASIDEKGEVSATEFRAFTIGAMVLEYFESMKVTAEEKARLTNCRERTKKQTSVGLRARSLEGVGFTAPYLHNGSVPTLYDLLRPAKDRPQTFFLGCRKYDIEKLGYDCDSKSGSFLFDTTLETNSNQGHEYGSTLGHEDRLDLIAYLKSLKQPDPASPKNPVCN